MADPQLEALTSVWVRLAEEMKFPIDYEGTPSPQVHQASEAIQARIRAHIIATHDMRLLGLLQLLGQASLRMEQMLWPDDYERILRRVEETLHTAGSNVTAGTPIR